MEGGIDHLEFIEQVAEKYRSCKEHTDEWRDEAEQCYAYVANDQWDDETRAILEEELRPIVTFNRTEIFVQAVTGLEALNRQEVRYIPRRPGPVGQGQADLWTEAAKYVNDDADAETHHSSAFRDLVICGMGWTETFLDLTTNPDGDIRIERRDPLSMYWDHKATQRNLSDARWIMHVARMTYEDVVERWPKAKDGIVYSRIFEPDYEPVSPHDASNAWKYENDQSKRIPGYEDDVYVVQYQWYEVEHFYRVKNPLKDGIEDFPAAQWERFREKYPEATSKMRVVGPFPKRAYKRAFIAGWTVLEIQDLVTDDFTFTCMTGKHDRNENVWYGLVRNLFDPQDWVNKLFSQILHIINSNSKGGLLAEKDAFDNVMDAEEQWARPDRITWLKPGALKSGKVQEKAMVPYPQGLDRLLTIAMSMFTEVTGANLELLGLADKVQPGILEAQRKQAGLTILAWAFDSMRAYRKKNGRILAQYIAEFIADGRLIRITGPEGQQYIPLIRDNLALEYDVVVDESPQSTNEKDRVFALLQQILPQMVQMGVMPPVEVLDYLPLPGPLIEAWKQQVKNPQQEQMQQMQMQMQARQQAAETAKTEAEAKEKEAAAQLKAAQAAVEPIKAMK